MDQRDVSTSRPIDTKVLSRRSWAEPASVGAFDMEPMKMALGLHVQPFCLGDWSTNCYVLHRELRDDPGAVPGATRGEGMSPPAKPCWIVDAGFGPEPMIRYIREQRLEPRAVILTHAHVDHIAGLKAVREVWPGAAILIHGSEQRFLNEPVLNLSVVLDEPVVAPPATGTLEHGQTVALDGIGFEVRHTPGHSPGGIVLYQPQAGLALVGDTLFAGSVGRTDFPTSNPAELIESIRRQLLTLPDETRVLPGHGPETTIGCERRENPFL